MTAAQLAEKTGAKLTMPRFTLLEGGRFHMHGHIRDRFKRMQTGAPIEDERWIAPIRKEPK